MYSVTDVSSLIPKNVKQRRTLQTFKWRKVNREEHTIREKRLLVTVIEGEVVGKKGEEEQNSNSQTASKVEITKEPKWYPGTEIFGEISVVGKLTIARTRQDDNDYEYSKEFRKYINII